MARRFYNLPPLTTLAAFETAARHLSFKEAAQELSVTPGAVSHQIKSLEEELGAKLFHRRHRGVELTTDGTLLFETLTSSFSQVSQKLNFIRERSANENVVVGSTSAVASLWLSPSVLRFWKEYPEVNVNQVVQERKLTGRTDLDLYIQYGRELHSKWDQTELYRDDLVAVTSLSLAKELKGISLEHLAQQRLIHLEPEDQKWTTWYEWFSEQGYDGTISSGVHVNNFSIALQAAQDGAGVALGWRRLVTPLLAVGKLTAVAPFTVPAPRRFYLIGKPEEELSKNARKLKNWLIRTA